MARIFVATELILLRFLEGPIIDCAEKILLSNAVMTSVESEKKALEIIIRQYVRLEECGEGEGLYYMGPCPFHKDDGKSNPRPLQVNPQKQTFFCWTRGCVAERRPPSVPLSVDDFQRLAIRHSLQPLPTNQTQIISEKTNRISRPNVEPRTLHIEEMSTLTDTTEVFKGEEQIAHQLLLFTEKGVLFPGISYSMLENYQLCPLKFKHLYINHENIGLATNQRLIGTSIHNTLREFYHLPPQERNESLLHDLLDKNWNNLRSGEENEYWHDKAYSMFDTFSESEDLALFPVSLEEGFNYLKDGISLIGRVDRIDQEPSGEYEVIDYKTLKREPENEAEAKGLLQSVFLYYGTYDIVGQFPHKVTYLHVQNGKRVSFLPNFEDMEIKFLEVKKMVEEINQLKDFIATKNQYCSACKLFGKCPATKNEVR